ncbi:MAG: hypothetical protein QM775_30980 [Pirellulales bacterium]
MFNIPNIHSTRHDGTGGLIVKVASRSVDCYATSPQLDAPASGSIMANYWVTYAENDNEGETSDHFKTRAPADARFEERRLQGRFVRLLRLQNGVTELKRANDHNRRIYICLVDAKNGFDPATIAAAKSGTQFGRFDFWNLKKSARPGEQVVFFMMPPRNAFMATGVISSEVRILREGSRFDGHYGADVRDLRFARELSLSDASTLFPRWSFLRRRSSHQEVPQSIVPLFLELLGTVTANPLTPELAAIEGLETEWRMLSKSRSRKLRDTVYAKANGICSVCARDYSMLRQSHGTRVLQVHHRDQLATTFTPRLTRERDLVVVCANCHLMLHPSPTRVLTVEALQILLRRDGFLPQLPR